MSKFHKDKIDNKNYGNTLWKVMKEIMKRAKHFYVYEVSLAFVHLKKYIYGGGGDKNN